MNDTIQITFPAENRTVTVPAGRSLLDMLRLAGIYIDAPCGGRGTCGKCLVSVDGKAPRLACTCYPDRDITAALPPADGRIIREENADFADYEDADSAGYKRADSIHYERADSAEYESADPEGEHFLAAADIGTTTVVLFLVRESDGKTIAVSSCTNPQTAYGADVITRIHEVLAHGSDTLTGCIRNAVDRLLTEASLRAGISPGRIRALSVVGNTCMHHLFLGIPVHTLAHAPYHPAVTHALKKTASQLGLYACPGADVYTPPNISGFVGGDTVACMTYTRLDRQPEWTLLLDIGTNGEIVLGCSKRLIACSAAAGPAFEGAGISCGMRGTEGAVIHAAWSEGAWELETVGDAPPAGICGSGLLDITAALLESGQMEPSGLLTEGGPVVLAGDCHATPAQDRTEVPAQDRRFIPAQDCPEAPAERHTVELTQKDIRALQLAKAAICAGIRLLCSHARIRLDDIRTVLLAGAFGSSLSPDSACAIGLIPPGLRGRIRPIGNAAGEGARLLVLHEEEKEYAQALAAKTEYLELASCRQFQDTFVDELEFPEPDR